VPLGSLREEFSILGRKLVPRRNWRGKTVDSGVSMQNGAHGKV